MVQAVVALTPAVQFTGAASAPPAEQPASVAPATQDGASAPPAEQNTAATVAPGKQFPVVEFRAAVPTAQTPDPLAISPKGTRIGDSYFGFPLEFWSDIMNTSFLYCFS
jgi:hypothetical protein